MDETLFSWNISGRGISHFILLDEIGFTWSSLLHFISWATSWEYFSTASPQATNCINWTSLHLLFALSVTMNLKRLIISSVSATLLTAFATYSHLPFINLPHSIHSLGGFDLLGQNLVSTFAWKMGNDHIFNHAPIFLKSNVTFSFQQKLSHVISLSEPAPYMVYGFLHHVSMSS